MFEDTNVKKIVLDRQIQDIENVVDRRWRLLNNASYEIGTLGASLFYAYYFMYKQKERYRDKAVELFKIGITQLKLKDFRRVFETDSLDNHLSNIGRYIAFLRDQQIVELDAEEYLSDIDNIISSLTKERLRNGNFDMHGGAMAGGYYFLTRDRDQQNIKNSLIEIIDSLELHACQDIEGNLFWKSTLLGDRTYLGISHGSALIISFLSKLYDIGIEKERCRELIIKGTNYILKNSISYEKGLFPHYIGDTEAGIKQFSLCYGDLGIGYAIYRSGQIINDQKSIDEGLDILLDCLNRSKSDNVTLDASLIYGASGLAETFSKIFLVSGDTKFDSAAQYWYSKIPEYAIHDNDFLGYKTRLVNAGDIWNLSFGWGVIGIGISLMRYIDRNLPSLSPLLFIA